MTYIKNVLVIMSVAFMILGVAVQAQPSGRDPSSQVVRMPNGIIEPCRARAYQTGLHQQFYDDGKRFLETQCSDGKKEGLSAKYYPDGRLWREEHYVEDQLHGVVKEYDFDGAVRVEEEYKQGQLTGWRRTYFSTGQVASEQEFRDGKAQGEVKNYDKDGKPARTEIFGDESQTPIYPATVTGAAADIPKLPHGRQEPPTNAEAPASIPVYEPYLNPPLKIKSGGDDGTIFDDSSGYRILRLRLCPGGDLKPGPRYNFLS